MKGKNMRTALIATALILVLQPFHASAAGETQVGVLNCTVEGGSGFIIGSKKELTCVFDRTSGASETYTGQISKFGIDIGKTKVSHLAWGVFAVSMDVADPGKLAGSYGGVTGEATVGVGLGANVLVGGFNNSIALQPISVQSQEGLNIAAGIAQLTLKQ
jgi:hypothetical protein